jgi:hypothetical protein
MVAGNHAGKLRQHALPIAEVLQTPDRGLTETAPQQKIVRTTEQNYGSCKLLVVARDLMKPVRYLFPTDRKAASKIILPSYLSTFRMHPNKNWQ